MKNLIYQYWDGDIRIGCEAGIDAMSAYAGRIGAKYLFEHNPRFVTNLGGMSKMYGMFKPVYDEAFHEYDNVLFADTDIFPVDGLTESIFDGFDAEVGICTEADQPKLRLNTEGRITSACDEAWAKLVKKIWGVDVPRTDDGLVKVYNAGLVMFSRAGLQKAKERFIPFKEYMNAISGSGVRLPGFYTSDQCYLHVMLDFVGMDWVELDNGWNSFVHYIKQKGEPRAINDTRTPDTKFVHVQLSGADHNDADWHWRIVNLPQSEWRL